MYLLLVMSFVVFVAFGLQLRFEEDIVKLLPRSSTDNELAFSEIDLKEKVFIQVVSSDTLQPASTARLGEAIDEFCRRVESRDTATRYFSGVFSALESDLAFGAMDFGLSHLPTFVDTSWYAAMQESLLPEAIDKRMEENYELVMEDEILGRILV